MGRLEVFEKSLPKLSEDPIELCNRINDIVAISGLKTNNPVVVPSPLDLNGIQVSKSFNLYDVKENDVKAAVQMLKTSNSSDVVMMEYPCPS
ncbi:hypothetical protein WA026_011359 [Henosepilachna vigintioctopunctata]|uniref:Uncharacterized protein n=1 Tax=Henosepilachna vigintioctopunctata TaxID=420089 RepID=A0AAW1TJF5_9CUCU